jgi:hypothetical protein
MWPYIWIVFMLALIVATTVVALREKKAREAAVKRMKPQPVDMGSADSMPDSIDDSFGEPDPLDSFGEPGVAAFDEDSFK